MPLTVALAIGKEFPDTLGYTLQTIQRTTGKDVEWRSDIDASDAQFKTIYQEGESGDNLVITLAVSRSILSDVMKFYNHSDHKFDALVYLEPQTGTGDDAITGAADAKALAQHAKTLIQKYRNQYQAKCVHLLIVCSQGFALFLGQHLRLLGEIATYEHQPTADTVYAPSVKWLS